ncbi:hypothetical protein IPN35_05540 [Candidatus Peregrinibacteria bacterium]|nr:MAG: hypothetical protein IPN35_05540 [Candidatus Peregrinibacteria bacterium]
MSEMNLRDEFRQNVSHWRAEYTNTNTSLSGSSDPRQREIVPFFCAVMTEESPESISSAQKTETLKIAKDLWEERASRILGDADSKIQPFGVDTKSKIHQEKAIVAAIKISLNDEKWKAFELGNAIQKTEIMRNATFIKSATMAQAINAFGVLQKIEHGIPPLVHNLYLSERYSSYNAPMPVSLPSSSKISSISQRLGSGGEKEEASPHTEQKKNQPQNAPLPRAPNQKPIQKRQRNQELFSTKKGGVIAGITGGILFFGMMFFS